MICFYVFVMVVVECVVMMSDGLKIMFNVIRARMSEFIYRIASMKFEDFVDGEDVICVCFVEFEDDIVFVFCVFEDEF